jgi:acyl-homoserine lactone synthase
MIFALSTEQLMGIPTLWEAVYRLRHDAFRQGRPWFGATPGGRYEVDAFDHEGTVHHLAIRDGELAGYQRILPTTRPHLLSEVMPDLCERTPPCGPDVFELSRHAVAGEFREEGSGLCSVGTELIVGLVEWGLARDVHKVVVARDPTWVLSAMQLRFRATPLGYQRCHAGQPLAATLLSFDACTLDAVRARLGSRGAVLAARLPDALACRRAS